MRKGYTVFAALVAVSLVTGAGAALATSGQVEPVAPVTAAPAVVAPVAAPAAAETCARKVRVVYSGYGNAPAACVTASR